MLTIATLIPAYNAVRYIGAALDSVAAQTRAPNEIIVVDDGSSDGTSLIVKEWASAHPNTNLKLIRQNNAGASAARNTAILASEADLIAFLDADDLLEPEHHAVLSGSLIANPSVIAAFGDQSVFSEIGEHSSSFLTGKPVEALPCEVTENGFRIIQQGLWGALVQGNFISMSASMTYRRIAIEVGLFDRELATSEDRDFWLRVSRQGGFGYLPQCLARERRHSTNLSGDANRSTVARHAFDVVLKQLHDANKLHLNQTERATTVLTLRKAARNFLYSASRDGLSAYRAGRKYLQHAAPQVLDLDLRGWLRALRARQSNTKPET